ncbi:hypothetical protein [Streptomyces sp. NRRL S-340]|uniref:hypothetical protein n=1 Tax=Streptomyces sp. NRRL S-340 TaxID=1463901 RepID=UPI000563391F|nr:hypothetical protein [Streptomyces sp. NRRL S-340]
MRTVGRAGSGCLHGRSPYATAWAFAGGCQVSGMLLDAEGEPVELPRISTLTMPLRWLRPVDMPVSQPPRRLRP